MHNQSNTDELLAELFRQNQNNKSLLQTQQLQLKNQQDTTSLLLKEMLDMKKSLNDRPSGSGTTTLPSNTIANPRGDVKAITTRSGVSYKEPTVPTTS